MAAPLLCLGTVGGAVAEATSTPTSTPTRCAGANLSPSAANTWSTQQVTFNARDNGRRLGEADNAL